MGCIGFFDDMCQHGQCSVVISGESGFTILAIRTVLLSAIVLFIRVISCDIVYI